jgi:uncharacterized protein DUF3293
VPAAILRAAYLSTTYRVDAPSGPIALRVGEGNRSLDGLLRGIGRNTWAFVTACNPRSHPLPGWRNGARQRRLRALVQRLRYPALPGAGIGDDPDWPLEPSLLIIGIGRARACRLARLFGQNAIVAGRRGCAAELVWCVPVRDIGPGELDLPDA